LLFFHFNAAPEGNEASDFAGGRLGIGVIPRCVGIILPVDQQAHVTRLPLPGTGGCGAAWTKILPFQTRLREIHIPFHCLGRITFSNDFAVPDRSRHSGFTVVFVPHMAQKYRRIRHYQTLRGVASPKRGTLFAVLFRCLNRVDVDALGRAVSGGGYGYLVAVEVGNGFRIVDGPDVLALVH
jgi:hypothetical protein